MFNIYIECGRESVNVDKGEIICKLNDLLTETFIGVKLIELFKTRWIIYMKELEML